MEVIYEKPFEKNTKRLNPFLKTKLSKQVEKVISNPEIGKPLKYKHGEEVFT